MKMRLLSVILLHGVCVLLLSAPIVSKVSLSVTPDRKQFFSRGALVILTCDDDDEQRVDGWTVKRTRAGVTERCGAAAGLVLKNSLCQLILINPSDGAYFCESSSGQRSDEVNIIISAGSLILDIPSSPVWIGSNVTLLCQSRDGKPGKSYFYKDGAMIGPDPKENLTLTNVQKSDEGLYSCSTDDHPHSHESRLTVRDPPPSVIASTTTTTCKPATRPLRPRPRRPRPRRPTPPTRRPPPPRPSPHHRPPPRHRPPRPPRRHRRPPPPPTRPPPRPPNRPPPRPPNRPPPPTRPPPRPPNRPPPPTRPPPRPPNRPPPPTRPPPPPRPRPRVIRSHSFGPPLTASIM